MNRRTQLYVALGAVALLVAGAGFFAYSLLGKPKLVTVKTGEIVTCTEGEVVSDTTREIQVPVNDAGKYSVKKTTVTCENHQKITTLWDEVQRALGSGDTKTAAEKLKALLALDPGNQQASKQLAEINAGKRPKPSTGGSSSGSTAATSAAGGSGVVSTAGGLDKYVPDSIPGYTAKNRIIDPASVTRDYVPNSGSADLMVIAAEQTVNAKTAAAAITQHKKTYPESASEVTVKSGLTGYFGVRGDSAAVAFSQGAVVVVVEMHAKSGKASSLKSAILDVAKRIAG